MMKKFLNTSILFILLIGQAYAQPENAQVETKDGKKYYVHIVEKGNTLYGIHRLYNVELDQILAANEGLDNNLTLGQKIYIPIPVSNEQHYDSYTVKQGETLYGISKKFDCSVADLKELNDGLTDGLQPGQVLTVPKAANKSKPGEVIQTDPVVKPTQTETEYNVSLQDSIIKHTVLKHETMYSISKRYMVSQDTIVALNNLTSIKVKKGDVLLIPVKKVNYEVVEKDLSQLDGQPQDSLSLGRDTTLLKDVYNVALFLPLMLDLNEREMSKPLKLGQVRELYPTTKISFEFYQGFLLAADSLSKAGLNVELYIYDTKRDTNTIAKYMNQDEFKAMDLVVGPLYRNTIDYAVNACKERGIRIVLPFNSDSDVLYQNPYVYKGVASNMTLLDGIVDYIIENHSQHKIILIKPTAAADLTLFERVRGRYNERIQSVSGAYSMKIVETSIGSSSGRDLNGVIDKDSTNVIIIPSTNLKFVARSMSTLNQMLNMNPYAKNLKVISFGLEDWNKYDDLDLKYRNRTYQHYASYRFIDYNDPQAVELNKSFRTSYGTDPSIYAVQGFDFGMYFMSALKLYGTNFDLAIDGHRMDLVQNDFKFRLIQQGSGRENQKVVIVRYNNFKLERMN